ncbi:dimeric dUTPase (all-alpha-NTP-PPase superfamily) [Solibacillus kalamii]|uniref:dUTPase n=1 Tax=Solibacillus kalamii TaxID=1748298 RepID=A0ABX3ZIT6_9BACL|nr:dUTP diphosphatase [Solibacillus kalamii]MBM7664601.1 dimeric dUTPase (all-alpha-NTP-PPase superfamily) [Solibacillus kalamii]OUZ39651.1 dUTPase [Solibacillus kalamii]
MQFRQLFEKQRQLDRFIEENQQVQKDVFAEKGLALLVELSELANETRCFKFWSTKGPSKRAVLLEEYVDSVHFMLSLGNIRGFLLEEWPYLKKKQELTETFLNTTQTILTFLQHQTEENYRAMWEQYSIIAYNLDFSIDDVLHAYELKNEKNYERQRNGY